MIQALCAFAIVGTKGNEKADKGKAGAYAAYKSREYLGSIRHSIPRGNLEWARDLGEKSRSRISNQPVGVYARYAQTLHRIRKIHVPENYLITYSYMLMATVNGYS